ncbi:MAG: ribonuclease H-like domain-containing protein [Armatimonadetes bacterium]|nr:ribonuclease H-like domain-containing protein [Armatimonadota bacterium]
MELRRRLEQLEQTGCLRTAVEQPAPSSALEEVVPGREIRNDSGAFYLLRREFADNTPYGPHPLSEARAFPGRWLARFGLEQLDPGTVVFLDTETTGLSGGSGTYAFLVGLAWFDRERLVVEQLLMREHAEERALLAYLRRILDGCGGLVTFNGKTFDLQLLQTRFLMNRMPCCLEEIDHLDLLHPCRRLWGPALPDCRLETLETEVLGLPRHDDTPGFLVPQLYFRFLRSGDARPLRGIAEHNRRDLLTMVGLLARMGRALQHPMEVRSAVEDYALARLMLDTGEESLGRALLERAVADGLPGEWRRAACLLLASWRRRAGDRRGAAELWKKVLAEYPWDPDAVEELAKHLEHRVGDYELALRLIERSLQGSRLSPTRRQRFEHRRRRLSERLPRSDSG